MRKIAILTYNHAALFELSCAVELFALPRPDFDNWYDCEVVSLDQGPHQSTGGLTIQSKHIASLEDYDTLVIPSWPTDISRIKGEFARQIKQFHTDGKCILSFCSGAFLLASLGLLDGRKATTHWRYSEKFKTRFPKINYVGDVLYVYDGNIGCSAGSATAIDLCLEVIRQDHGNHVANRVARRLVMSPHRQGGQAQFVESPVLKTGDQFSQSLEWAQLNIQQSLNIDKLAERANMSRRTFDRKFRAAHNLTAKEWLTLQRIDLAKEILEQETASIEHVADRVGFENATTMRHHFRKKLGISPRQYRDQFAIT